jgi:hypothetical protein
MSTNAFSDLIDTKAFDGLGADGGGSAWSSSSDSDSFISQGAAGGGFGALDPLSDFGGGDALMTGVPDLVHAADAASGGGGSSMPLGLMENPYEMYAA